MRLAPRLFAVLSLVALVLTSTHSVLLSLTKTAEGAESGDPPRIPFHSASVVTCQELLKLLLCLGGLWLGSPHGREQTLAGGNSVAALSSMSWRRQLRALLRDRTTALLALPALCYAFNNNIVVVIQKEMDPATFQVLCSLKIATTAVILRLALGRPLSHTQWLAVALLCVSSAVNSSSAYRSQPIPMRPLSSATADHRDHMHERRPGREQNANSNAAAAHGQFDRSQAYVTPAGLGLLLLYCTVSGGAAVLSQVLLQSNDSKGRSLFLQGVPMYGAGVLLNLVAVAGTVPSLGAIFEGFTALTWVIIAGQAANGLIYATIMQQGRWLTRLFIIAGSMLLSTAFAALMLGLQPPPQFFVGLAIALTAVFVYYRPGSASAAAGAAAPRIPTTIAPTSKAKSTVKEL